MGRLQAIWLACSQALAMSPAPLRPGASPLRRAATRYDVSWRRKYAATEPVGRQEKYQPFRTLGVNQAVAASEGLGRSHRSPVPEPLVAARLEAALSEAARLEAALTGTALQEAELREITSRAQQGAQARKLAQMEAQLKHLAEVQKMMAARTTELFANSNMGSALASTSQFDAVQRAGDKIIADLMSALKIVREATLSASDLEDNVGQPGLFDEPRQR